MEREDRLRDAMVASLERQGALSSARVAAALRAVPRHRFIPESSPEDAYSDRAIAIKLHAGEIVSSISQPAMLAQMLELLDVSPGNRVLEIGTGSGYNAALLAELCGPAGEVVTLDLDAEMVLRARTALSELGYRNVRVVEADGSASLERNAAFDRIAVSARSDDIAAAWWDALAEGGRLVLPLRLERAGEFALGFERRGKRLASTGAHPCAFIALRGEAARAGPSEIFYRDPRDRTPATARRLTSVVAIRARDATHDLLGESDIVIARPETIFSIRFA